MPLLIHSPASNRLNRILDRLACPQCRASLTWHNGSLDCDSCGKYYRIIDDIPDLRPAAHREKDESIAWSQHWSPANQRSRAQRFFSFYRKVVFARTVQYFLDRHFPPTGVFVEAGSGTSETSMRIDKRDGARCLVATDIVLSVLSRCHPVMDVRVCGDIFCLPFRDASVEGIWNVGVMEHFTHEKIDQMMREFHRVLTPGGPIILLWPGADSIPQRLLRVIEALINWKRRGGKFHFHPDEISQLKSMQEGRDVLERNGFHVRQIDYGFRSLMAFKTLVGEKTQ
jgi:predicted SAM-dependent methyltransferase/uncharacterized protein YbaR (Trm112 family)